MIFTITGSAGSTGTSEKCSLVITTELPSGTAVPSTFSIVSVHEIDIGTTDMQIEIPAGQYGIITPFVVGA